MEDLGIGVEVEVEEVGVGKKFYEVVHGRFLGKLGQEGNLH